MDKTGSCIVNMLNTRRGTHPLFRTYGLNDTDGAPISRASMQSEIAKWYPQARIRAFSVVSAEISGRFEYKIEVEGV